MFMPSNQVMVYLAISPVDMRCGYDRLAYHCREMLQQDPYSGHMFLFFNRNRTRARIFYFDGSGSCLFSKRLESGTFKLPKVSADAGSVTVSASELSLLLEGADIGQLSYPETWRPTPAPTQQPTQDHLN